MPAVEPEQRPRGQAWLRQALAVYPIADLTHSSRHWSALVAAALRGGATLLQLRDKREGAHSVVELARKVGRLLERAGVPLIINDRLDVALAINAAGVHLGQRDMAPERALELAKRAGRSDLVVGVSVASVAEADAAIRQGASYLSISPVFGTPTKPDIDRPVGLQGLQNIRQKYPTQPLCAIGGIHPGNAESVIRAGADGVAFVSSVRSRCPEASVRAMSAAVAVGRREGLALYQGDFHGP